MERLKHSIAFLRFSLKVFLFNALLLISVISPLWILNKENHNAFLDRMTFHLNFFTAAARSIDGISLPEMEARLKEMPGIFSGQSFFIFGPEYASGFPVEPAAEEWYEDSFKLVLPHPYADVPADTDRLRDFLQSRVLPEFSKTEYILHSLMTISGPSGLNRIAVWAGRVFSENGEPYIMVLTSDLTDILMQGRAVKERFMFISAAVILMGLILTVMLSRSVTRPFRRLYRYAEDINKKGWNAGDPPDFPGGEFAAVYRSLQGLLLQQQRRSEGFRRFSSDAVHELKTPLTAIRSAVEMLSDAADDDERRRLNSLINRRIERMEGLMNEIARLGRIEASTDGKEVVDAEVAVKGLADDYGRHRIKIRTDTELRGITLPLSAEDLGSLFDNLIENALDFSPEPGSVAVRIWREPGKFCFRVSDSGPGIASEHMNRITERFYSGRSSDRREHYGLGLSIVTAVLDNCGGSLGYENNPEGGAVFTVKLPCFCRGSDPNPNCCS